MIKILFLLLTSLLFAQQQTTPRSIDSEFIKANNLLKNRKTNDYIKANRTILNNSKKIKYSKGIVISCTNLATRYFFAGKHFESLFYLKLTAKEEYAKNNISAQISILNLFSYNYIRIGLYREAIKEFQNIIRLANQIVDPDVNIKLKSQAQAYFDTGVIYRWKYNRDSSAFYIKKAVQILQSEKNLNAESKSLLVWILLESIELKLEKKIDSAEIDLKKLENRPEKLLGNKIFKLYQVRGLINDNKKEYELAIKNYKKAISSAKEAQNSFALQYLYELIIAAYIKKGDIRLSEKYREEYKSLSDGLTVNKQALIEPTVKELIQHKEKKIKSKIKILIYFICASIIILIILILLIIFKIRTNRSKLREKGQETEILNKKINPRFDHLVQLAKKNDSEFMTRFTEFYPDFFPKLLNMEPCMQSSELHFCALLFLNFSTKDIARYTFVKPQSVQTRKSRLRKKLKISSTEDIYVWMKNL